MAVCSKPTSGPNSAAESCKSWLQPNKLLAGSCCHTRPACYRQSLDDVLICLFSFPNLRVPCPLLPPQELQVSGIIYEFWMVALRLCGSTLGQQAPLRPVLPKRTALQFRPSPYSTAVPASTIHNTPAAAATNCEGGGVR